MKYPVGTKLLSTATGIKGEVIENFKLPGDICVRWETGQVISYDPEWLDANCEGNGCHGEAGYGNAPRTAITTPPSKG